MVMPVRALPAVVLLGLMVVACSRDSSPPSSGPAGANTTAPRSTVTIPLGQPTQVDRSASDQALSREVFSFLDGWLIQRDPRGAVRERASAAFPDERFVPAGWFDPAVYRERFSPSRMSTPSAIQPQDFQNRLGEYVESLTDTPEAAPKDAAKPATLSSLLLPLSPGTIRDVDPQLATILEPRKPRELRVADVPSLAYDVRGWDDIAWTASATIGYRAALAQQIREKAIDMQAVVCRLRPDTADAPLTLVVTLWSDEGSRGATWRLVGLELPAAR